MIVDENILIKYLDGTLTDEERTRVDDWVAESTENEKLLEQVYFTLQVTDRLRVMESVDPEMALVRFKSRVRKQNKKVSFRRSLQFMQRVAAILFIPVLVLSAYFFMQTGKEKVRMVEVRTNPGVVSTFELPDGSKVWVNSDSKLIYGSRFTSNERILKLEGEAYFEVTPDKNRPFIVETENFSVKALGTSFNIKAYKEDSWASTVLMTGKVKVQSESEMFILEPNQRISFDRTTGKMDKSNVVDATDFSGWMYNTLSFDAETFEDIVQTLQRLYNTRIIFESESLKKYRFTGSPSNTSLESILQILSLTSPLSYEVKDSVIILRENTKEKAWYEKALK